MRLGGRQAGLERAVDQQPPHLLERDLADELLDVDAAVAERAALAIGLGDFGGEGDDAFETGLDVVAHAPEGWQVEPERGVLTPRPRALGWRPRMSDLMAMSVGELAAHVRGGELRAREVVTAALERIEERDGEINAFVEVDADGALATADTIEPGDERPFAGVPIAIKANTPVEGLRMNFGSKFLGGHRPDHSAYLVRRLQDAGFVIVGITNMPEFGILPTTEPREGGPTRNPWDTTRTPGGSSGGAAAAVAGGMLPVAHGNDGGGSLRIPASCCGLVGPQAQPRPGVARPRPRRLVPRLRRRAHPHGGRDGGSCSTCSPATRSATRPGRRAPPSPTRPPCAATRAGCASR